MAPGNKPKRGRPRRMPDVSVMVGMRITPEDRSRFVAIARKNNMSFSQWVRAALEEFSKR